MSRPTAVLRHEAPRMCRAPVSCLEHLAKFAKQRIGGSSPCSEVGPCHGPTGMVPNGVEIPAAEQEKVNYAANRSAHRSEDRALRGYVQAVRSHGVVTNAPRPMEELALTEDGR
jgi:hypothetical protein